ncbi:MAG: hypothetical protein ACK55I_05105, partial [bacterium]
MRSMSVAENAVAGDLVDGRADRVPSGGNAVEEKAFATLYYSRHREVVVELALPIISYPALLESKSEFRREQSAKTLRIFLVTQDLRDAPCLHPALVIPLEVFDTRTRSSGLQRVEKRLRRVEVFLVGVVGFGDVP